MTSELRPAVTRADALRFLERATRNWKRLGPLSESDVDDVAGALQADREAVRAYWYRQGKDDGWQCREEQAAELAKWKALAETLAGALPDIIDLFRIIRAAGKSNEAKAQAVYAHLSQALTSYKEQRDGQ